VTHYDDPADIARLVVACQPPKLVGLDVDGVLAPIVDHADTATLLDGMAAAVSAVAALDGVHVAVVSGRALAGLEQFGFGDDVHVIGSHGMETRDQPLAPLTDAELTCLGHLRAAADRAAARAGEGAWVEHKPASVVLHVRQAEDEAGRVALGDLAHAAGEVEGAATKAGSGVLEAFARHADKGTALVELGDRLGVATTVFVGDDVTDEEAFTRLGVHDVAIKVGDADTVARHRLRDPDAVLTFLRALASTTFA
jgi:trehalose-phosphatase